MAGRIEREMHLMFIMLMIDLRGWFWCVRVYYRKMNDQFRYVYLIYHYLLPIVSGMLQCNYYFLIHISILVLRSCVAAIGYCNILKKYSTSNLPSSGKSVQ